MTNRNPEKDTKYIFSETRHPRGVRRPPLSHRSFSSYPAACSHRHGALMSRSGKMKGRRRLSVGTVEEPERAWGEWRARGKEGEDAQEEAKSRARPLRWARRSESERVRERRTEVAEVELMHAPGHAPKPLTGSQPTSLYDKYKRRAQRLLLIAWQKLRNPHFVLRTPNSYRRASTSYSLSLSLSFSLALTHHAYPPVRGKSDGLSSSSSSSSTVPSILKPRCLSIIFYT